MEDKTTNSVQHVPTPEQSTPEQPTVVPVGNILMDIPHFDTSDYVTKSYVDTQKPSETKDE